MKKLNKVVGILCTVICFVFFSYLTYEIFSGNFTFYEFSILFLLLGITSLFITFLSLNSFGFSNSSNVKVNSFLKGLVYICIAIISVSFIFGIFSFISSNSDNKKVFALTRSYDYVLMDTIELPQDFKGLLKYKINREKLQYQVLILSDKDTNNYRDYIFILELMDKDGFLIYKMELSEFVKNFSKDTFLYIEFKGTIELPDYEISMIKDYSILVKKRYNF